MVNVKNHPKIGLFVMPYFIINGKDGKVFINAEKRGRIKSIIKITESRKLYLKVALKQRRKQRMLPFYVRTSCCKGKTLQKRE